MNIEVFMTEEQKLKKEIERLNAELAEAKSEMKYFEKELLSGDGHRCEECGKVRHINDCIRVGEFYACSEGCAGILAEQLEAEDGLRTEDFIRVQKWSNGER